MIRSILTSTLTLTIPITIQFTIKQYYIVYIVYTYSHLHPIMMTIIHIFNILPFHTRNIRVNNPNLPAAANALSSVGCRMELPKKHGPGLIERWVFPIENWGMFKKACNVSLVW